MQAKRSEPVQSTVILQLLRDDHPGCWTVGTLEAELAHVERSDLRAALSELQAHGVASVHRERVVVAEPVRHLDELGLIGV